VTGDRQDKQPGCQRPSEVEAFYDAAVPEADRVALAVAREVEGIDQEIAVLRVRLRRALEDHPENMPLMLKGIEMLTKALATRHRLSKGAKDDVSTNMRALLSEFDRYTSPEATSGVVADEGN
jgi:hypothetical protein